MSWDSSFRLFQKSKKNYQTQQKEWKKQDFMLYMNQAINKIATIERLEKQKNTSIDIKCKNREIALKMLEARYQRLIKKFSPAYLETCEWYLGPSLIGNTNFVFPYYVFDSQYYQWKKSLWLVSILTNHSYEE